MSSIDSPSPSGGDEAFLGLAPFLRLSIAGADLTTVGQELLARAQEAPDSPNLWMNLATAMLCLGQRELGLRIQAEALAMQRLHALPATRQPASCRLLVLMAPGDLSANTPIDCLLENADIDLVFYYVAAGAPLPTPLPHHDVLLVAIGETEENRPLLAALEPALANWPQPVINSPRAIPATGRSAASRLLQDAPGLFIPPSLRVPRSVLMAVASGGVGLPALFADCDFPVILRPVDSHAGRDLERLANASELATYLARVREAEFFLSPFIDYSGPDGRYRKFRVALIDGAPYASHMAVSSHWMVHYLNAGMYEDAAKRREEEAFMADFDAFAARHAQALAAIHTRIGLDYVCIDCAEMHDGRLLIFEVDHAMVVHAMDSAELFPYKQEYMHKVKSAFRAYLLRLADPGPR